MTFRDSNSFLQLSECKKEDYLYEGSRMQPGGQVILTFLVWFLIFLHLPVSRLRSFPGGQGFNAGLRGATSLGGVGCLIGVRGFGITFTFLVAGGLTALILRQRPVAGFLSWPGGQGLGDLRVRAWFFAIFLIAGVTSLMHCPFGARFVPFGHLLL